jgi:hypothetical protein
MFAAQYTQAIAECAVAAACTPVWSVGIAANALFVSVAGLAAAVALAVGVGVSWRRNTIPNTSLARDLEYQGRNLEEYRLRRAQLDEWTAMAQARAMERAAMEEAEALADAEAIAAQDEVLMSQISLWEEDAPEEQSETDDQVRHRVMAEHLAHLARSHPEAVAEVLKTWINQPAR